MEVEANVWYWSAFGMLRRQPFAVSAAYVLKEDAERLLEQAHERGRQLGLMQAQEIIERR